MRIKKNWTMRKSIFTLVGIVMATASVMASTVSDKDRAIRYEELPADARTFIKHHYPNEQPTYMWEDKDHNHTEYKVVMANGVKLEFDERGNWTEVDTPNAMVLPISFPRRLPTMWQRSIPRIRLWRFLRSATSGRLSSTMVLSWSSTTSITSLRSTNAR